jgi:hypothetical protein
VRPLVHGVFDPQLRCLGQDADAPDAVPREAFVNQELGLTASLPVIVVVCVEPRPPAHYGKVNLVDIPKIIEESLRLSYRMTICEYESQSSLRYVLGVADEINNLILIFQLSSYVAVNIGEQHWRARPGLTLSLALGGACPGCWRRAIEGVARLPRAGRPVPRCATGPWANETRTETSGQSGLSVGEEPT